MFSCDSICLIYVYYVDVVKKILVSSRLFIKEEGGPYYLLFMIFLLLVSKIAAMS